ncbi:MAG: class I SAM-dependent methyltransferase [Bacteroidota bacterium]
MQNSETIKKKEWFGEWFNSPYYHILYKHRDYNEARVFIDNLVKYFDFQKDHKIQDLACGKGRHSIYLNEKGFDVVGVDLSAKNIEHAQQFENDRLHFHIHDMREVFQEESFDFILNLFTSFGYFDSAKENEKAICSAAKGLKPGGKLLIDFLNTYTVVHNLVPCEEKLIDGIEFKITKRLSDDGFILKDIEFEDQGKQYRFQEKVKAIRKVDFLHCFEKAKLKLEGVFGDYNLNPYDEKHSDRMIFVVQK